MENSKNSENLDDLLSPYYIDEKIGRPKQTQTIKQVMKDGFVLLSTELNEITIKTAIPVAEWYVILRNTRSLSSFTFTDPTNESVAYFRPFIDSGIFEITIDLAPIKIGSRFAKINKLNDKTKPIKK